MTDHSTRSVDRTLDLLIYICDRGTIGQGCQLNDCAEHTSLSPSTALRLLRSLMLRGFVDRDEAGLFHPGTQIVRIGASALSGDNLIRLAKPAMSRIVKEVNESVYLLRRNFDGDCLYIAVCQCQRSIQHVSWVGMTIPSKGSAAGKVLDGMVELGTHVVVRGKVEPDVTAISTPLIAGNTPVAALSIVAPTYRLTSENEDRYGAILAQEATALSKQLS